MHTFLVDETNKGTKRRDLFFIVGGLVFTPAQANAVHDLVLGIRRKYKYAALVKFKFDTNERPAHLTIEQARDAKNEVLKGLDELGVRMLVTHVLKEVGESQNYVTQMNWSLNTLARAYRKLLLADGSRGSLILDRDDKQIPHLEHLLHEGLQMPNNVTEMLDDRIQLYGTTTINSSHLSSAADIALGAFRMCANAAVDATREEAAGAVFPLVARLLWRGSAPDGRTTVLKFGYHPRPKRENIRDPRIAASYDQLEARFDSFASAARPQGDNAPRSGDALADG